MSEITQFQRNQMSVLLLSKFIQHTKITLFSTKAYFQQICYWTQKYNGNYKKAVSVISLKSQI